jgi:hypothetical protein
MLKYGYKRTAACTLCKKAHEESGSSWNGELPKETIGDIQSSGCLGQKEVVTAAHNACIRELLQEVNVHGNANRHMKLLTRQNELSRQKAVGHTLGPRTVYAWSMLSNCAHLVAPSLKATCALHKIWT